MPFPKITVFPVYTCLIAYCTLLTENAPNLKTMKSIVSPMLLLAAICFTQYTVAQKSVSEYVEKNNPEKIQKSIFLDGQPVKSGPKSFRDGHSKWPLITSHDQLPDTIALITYNVGDLGYFTSWKSNTHLYKESFCLTDEGGNMVANAILAETLTALKEEFLKNGVVLLTPEEFLDTPEKHQYYYYDFEPTVSKIGQFLSNLENKHMDNVVGADTYRYFDMGAAFDYLRAESLGDQLARKLGVDGVMSIGYEIASNPGEVYLRAMKMAIHIPNPIPREDKKYIGQKSGTGYYTGQMLVGGTLRFKNPFKAVLFRKGQAPQMDFKGMDVICSSFIQKFYTAINECIEKVGDKK